MPICSLDNQLHSHLVWQVIVQVPTVRILKGHDNRYVISSAGEASSWRPLAENGLPIYSYELIFQGALKQKLDFETEETKVAGSF